MPPGPHRAARRRQRRATADRLGVRTPGGRYVFPRDIEARLDDRERRLLARMERLQELHAANAELEAATTGSGRGTSGDGGRAEDER